MNSFAAAIAFARTGGHDNPNLPIPPSDALAAYLRAITVTFASLRRWNPALDLELITDSDPPPSWLEALHDLNVAIRVRPFEHRPPAGFFPSFGPSLYMLDAIAAQTRDTLFIDPDVLCVRPLDTMFRFIGSAAGALPRPFDIDYDINGLTLRQAAMQHMELGASGRNVIHYGGECYVIPFAYARTLTEACNRAWELALQRHAANREHFTTEEHILSYALTTVPVCSVEGFVKRIWTAARYRNVDGTEAELTLWHLPAEKDRGFRRLHGAAMDRESWFWNAPGGIYTKLAGRALGLWDRGPHRLARDMVGSTLRRFTG